MKFGLEKLTEITSDCCITVILNTHRTSPDCLLDAIQLKNLIKEAEQKLHKEVDLKVATTLTNKLHTLSAEIDHNYNLESLLLFVNEETAEYVRLPIAVKDRVIIEKTFATRDLFRAENMACSYYVLILDRDKARLIEAKNDQLVQEFSTPFPIKNEQFDTANWVDLGDTSRQTNLLTEFLNKVDKEVNKIRNSKSLPILISASEENFAHYLKSADRKETILKLNFNKKANTDKAGAVVAEAWEIMNEYQISKNELRKHELKRAVDENKFLSDTNEIWKAIKNGQIETLFIEVGLFKSAMVNNNEISFIAEDEDGQATNRFDDIYDEMIEQNMKFGGDVVFLPKNDLADFNGFGAITRY